MHASAITVSAGGQIVFQAEGGRLGTAASANSDFLCWASQQIGAAYTSVEDAAVRLRSLGYAVVIHSARVL